MFYKFYRLKQKKGAVLMLVVVVMSLLVIIASTAYYSARSAYKTVISNYDFSQLYLSATSVSDMMLDAVANDTSVSSANNFAGLKKAVLALTTQDSYIDLSDTATDSVEDGVLDSVSVKITLTGIEDVTDKLTGKDTGLDRYIYTFETYAEYRSNSITVQDVIYNERGIKSDPPEFDTFFTATGQELVVGGDGTVSSAKTSSRKVIINTNEISDDAYFENEITIFQETNTNNKVTGGLTSSGSVYLQKLNCDIAAPDAGTSVAEMDTAGVTTVDGDRNDWFIGKDLVLMDDRATLNLNGNNLYVGGNLIILNQKTLSAANIYVLGDVYLLSQCTINGNLYVKGEIKSEDDAGIVSSVVSAAGAETGLYSFGTNSNPRYYVGETLDNIIYQEVPAQLPYVYTGSADYIFGGTATDTVNHQYGNVKISQWLDPNNTPVAIAVMNENDDMSAYEHTVQRTTLDTAMDSKTGTSSYGSYTTDATKALSNSLVIDVYRWSEYVDGVPQFPGATSVVKESDQNFVATFKATNGEVATVYMNNTGNGSIQIDLPYSVKGYALTLLNTAEYTNGITVNIQTKAENTMTVVLNGNITYGTVDKTDLNGYNAFSWKGSQYSSTASQSQVNLLPDATTGEYGNVVFEMGNYSTTDGTYTSYDATKPNDTESVIYVLATFETVGTKAQVEKIVSLGWDNGTSIEEAMLDENSVPLSAEYNNRIVLVSNANGKIAIDGSQMKNTLCAYMYAPNGTYYVASGANGTAQIFGGMIVSTYNINMIHCIYAEPIPSVIEDAFSALTESSVGSDLKLEDGVWYQLGSNYLG